MKRNFRLSQGVELLSEGKYYDLHNCYDLGGVCVFPGRFLLLGFEGNPEWGKGLGPVTLRFESIYWLEFSQQFGIGDTEGVDEIGFKSPKDFDYEWLLCEEQSSTEDHLVFRFVNGNFIRVHSKTAQLLSGSLIDSWA